MSTLNPAEYDTISWKEMHYNYGECNRAWKKFMEHVKVYKRKSIWRKPIAGFGEKCRLDRVRNEGGKSRSDLGGPNKWAACMDTALLKTRNGPDFAPA